MSSTDHNINTYLETLENRQEAAFVENIRLDKNFREAFTVGSNSFLSKKFQDLKTVIGEELYGKLSDEDRLFMADTAGTIDFGRSIDLDAVARNIKEYGDTE